MSQENVEIVRRFYRAWARNDLPGPVELMDPEIEYVNPVRCRGAGTRRGLTAFSRAVEKVFEGVGNMATSSRSELRARGRSGRGGDSLPRSRSMGAEPRWRPEIGALWTLRDGKVVRYAWFHEPADALEAAGLSE